VKRIVFVSNTLWSFYKFRKELIIEFIRSGYEVILIAPKDDYAEYFVSQGAQVVELNELSPKGSNVFQDLFLLRALVKIYGRLRPDIIVQYTIKPNIYGSIAARFLRIPFISVITGLGYVFLNKGFVPYISKQLYKFALKGARNVWFLNVYDRDIFVGKDKHIPFPGKGLMWRNLTPHYLDTNGRSKEKGKTASYYLPGCCMIREF
jgi:UDP-N-acetylglucosamine:LPS N-acetylglucosamine transferase